MPLHSIKVWREKTTSTKTNKTRRLSALAQATCFDSTGILAWGRSESRWKTKEHSTGYGWGVEYTHLHLRPLIHRDSARLAKNNSASPESRIVRVGNAVARAFPLNYHNNDRVSDNHNVIEALQTRTLNRVDNRFRG